MKATHDSRVVVSKSEINYDYTTIGMTKSRIEKGLIAMPVALAKWFPPRTTFECI